MDFSWNPSPVNFLTMRAWSNSLISLSISFLICVRDYEYAFPRSCGKDKWDLYSAHALSKCTKLLQSCLTLCDPMGCSPPRAPLSMGVSRHEYWTGLPCPSPGDLPNPGFSSKFQKQIPKTREQLDAKMISQPVVVLLVKGVSGSR